MLYRNFHRTPRAHSTCTRKGSIPRPLCENLRRSFFQNKLSPKFQLYKTTHSSLHMRPLSPPPLSQSFRHSMERRKQRKMSPGRRRYFARQRGRRVHKKKEVKDPLEHSMDIAYEMAEYVLAEPPSPPPSPLSFALCFPKLPVAKESPSVFNHLMEPNMFLPCPALIFGVEKEELEEPTGFEGVTKVFPHTPMPTLAAE